MSFLSTQSHATQSHGEAANGASEMEWAGAVLGSRIESILLSLALAAAALAVSAGWVALALS